MPALSNDSYEEAFRRLDHVASVRGGELLRTDIGECARWYRDIPAALRALTSYAESKGYRLAGEPYR